MFSFLYCFFYTLQITAIWHLSLSILVCRGSVIALYVCLFALFVMHVETIVWHYSWCMKSLWFLFQNVIQSQIQKHETTAKKIVTEQHWGHSILLSTHWHRITLIFAFVFRTFYENVVLIVYRIFFITRLNFAWYLYINYWSRAEHSRNQYNIIENISRMRCALRIIPWYVVGAP